MFTAENLTADHVHALRENEACSGLSLRTLQLCQAALSNNGGPITGTAARPDIYGRITQADARVEVARLLNGARSELCELYCSRAVAAGVPRAHAHMIAMDAHLGRALRPLRHTNEHGQLCDEPQGSWCLVWKEGTAYGCAWHPEIAGEAGIATLEDALACFVRAV